jgi:acetyl esterase/lipase
VLLSLNLRIVRSLLRRPRTLAYGEDRNQVAELSLPEGPGPFPVAVLLHGGYWRTRYGRRVCRPLAERLRALGFAVVNVEYRRVGRGRAGGGGWPATFDDVAAALDGLDGAFADALDRADRTDVTVVGHSAGGQLALWAAARPQLPPGAPGASPAVRVTRVVALSPVLAMERAGDAAEALLGGPPATYPGRWAQADPSRLPPPSVPTLVVHPTADETIPVARSRTWVQRCRDAGAPVELADPPDEGHMHVILPTSASWAAAERWLAAQGARR